MKICLSQHSSCIALLAWVLSTLLGQPVLAAEYFDQYGLTPSSAELNLGIQPHGYPSGVISAVMSHDRIMQNALTRLASPLKMHPFQRGADMLSLLADQRLEAGLLDQSDDPDIATGCCQNGRYVTKQTSTSIVAKNETQTRKLAGKRIAYVENSSAHHTLLQGLKAAGLSEADVKLINMRIDEMPDALEAGKIDAFAAWEPAPTSALARSNKNHMVFRGLSSDYFVINRAFEQRSPETARILIAGYVRAIEFMRRSQKNVEIAAKWAIADAQDFSAKAGEIAPSQVIAITRRDILNIPSAPAILAPPGSPVLLSEFKFLKERGKIPADGQWENITEALGYRGLSQVMSEQRRYEIGTFDYAP